MNGDRMDNDRYILPGILILIVIIVLVIAIAFSGNNNFQMGKVSFQYPNGWSQNHVVGNFSNSSLYSEATFTANFPDSNGQTQTSYIIIQMQQKAQGQLNLPPNSTTTNTTNSSVGTVIVSDNITATQLGTLGTNVAAKATIIDFNNYYYTIEFVCPPYALNQTATAYNTILKTLKIS
jgi:hypothetical protein